MDATAMAYVTIVLAGISLQSPEPVTLEQCTALKVEQPQTLCIDVEPPCGKGEAVKCLGRADLEETTPQVRKPSSRKRRYAHRRRSSVTVGQLVQKAF